MKRFSSMAMLVCFVALVVWGGVSQTADGPYIIVDQTVAAPWGHVFGSLPAAIAYINALPNVEEMAGATIIIYPGTYTTAATIVLNVPGLRITTRDGADRTILKGVGPFTGTDVLSVTAPGVVIEDVTIQDATGGLNGIAVWSRDCTLQRLQISDVGGNGVVVWAGADQLVVDAVETVGSVLNGIVVGPVGGPVWDTTILNSTFRSNWTNGISLVAARRVAVLRSSCLGNVGNGINIIAGCSRVEISQCEISSNGAGGVTDAGTAQLSLEQNTFRGNAGAAILLAGTGPAIVADNSFSQNLGPAVSLAGVCTDVVVQDNTITAQAGTPLPVTAVTIGGASSNCTVQRNSIDGYHHAIQLMAASAPRGNSILSNTISNSISDGIWVCGSGGSNTFSQNSVSNCGGHGIYVQAAASDEYAGNQVTDCTLSGIAVDDGIAVVNNLTIERNSLSGCGQDGITIFDILNGTAMSSILIFGNQIEGNDKIGLSVNSDPAGAGTDPTTNLRIEGNIILSNEGGGVSFSSAPGCVIVKNVIADCLGIGITGTHTALGATQIRHNSIHDNDGGGVFLALGGLTGAVVEENAIFDNQGYGVTIAGAPVPPFPFPYPFGVSLGSNWWGSPTGPAGFFSGRGNAVLGVPGISKNAIAPVLTAPVIATYTADVEVLKNAQVSVIPSFAATKVEVNRLDTSGVRLVFSDVEPRASGLANTALYTSTALSEYLPASGGQILRAVAVLLAGFDTGTVEVSLAYDPEQLAGRSPEDISVLALTGGVWAFDVTPGSWKLEGAVWSTLSGCPVPGASLIAVEIPVSQLRGEYLAVALALSATERAD